MRKIHLILRSKGLLLVAILVMIAIPGLWGAGFTRPPVSVALAQSESPPSGVDSDGQVEQGRALFMGNLHFEEDGPPCMGCHNVDAQLQRCASYQLGGGALGPDLTNVITRYGDQGLQIALAEIPWPTMQPIYKDHPLTAAEQASLFAFLKASAGQQETNRELLVIGISLVGFAAAVILIGFLYRRRLRGVRKPLVKQAQSGRVGG